MQLRYSIAREGLPFIIFFGIITLTAIYYLNFLWAILPLILTLFCIYFFRDPIRNIETTSNIIVSPADGKIMDIQEVHENKFLNDNVIKISIFLSIFDVHINRIPVKGIISDYQKVGGIFLPAYKKEASDLNVRSYIVIDSKWGKVMVAQITGLIARRIVCKVRPGDKVETGDKFGLIRFGSCTELYLPINCEILVKPGDKVRGGETIIAKFCN